MLLAPLFHKELGLHNISKVSKALAQGAQFFGMKDGNIPSYHQVKECPMFNPSVELKSERAE